MLEHKIENEPNNVMFSPKKEETPLMEIEMVFQIFFYWLKLGIIIIILRAGI